jgi:hypothetical protein
MGILYLTFLSLSSSLFKIFADDPVTRLNPSYELLDHSVLQTVHV